MNLLVFADEKIQKNGLEKAVGRASGNRAATQFSLFAISNENIIDELREIEISKLTSDEAKDILQNLINRII